MRYWAFVAVILMFIVPMSVMAQDNEPNKAALVITLGEGETISQCVAFAEPEISGFDLLQASGLALETDVSFGGTVCSIEGTGCGSDDCFCQCKGGDCLYWSYWLQKQGEWQYSQIGASGYTVQPGEVQGWSWGVGQPNQAVEPEMLSFDDVCAVPEPTAVPPTIAPLPTSEPNDEPAEVAEVVATVEPVSAETAVPVVESAETDESSTSNYLLFAVIVAVLLTLFGMTRRKG